MALVTVIIPCYNSEKYLATCLDSIISQSIGIDNIEVICINDASTDGTFDLLCQYESRYPNSFLIINNEINTKQGYARNLAIKYSSAKYITFVDSDDYIDANALKKMYSIITSNNYDYVSCRYYRVVNNEKHILDDSSNEPIEYVIDTDADRKNFILDECDNPGCCSTLYSKEFIVTNDIKFAEDIFYEDLLWLGLTRLYAQKVMIIPDRFYYYVDYTSQSVVTKRNSSHHFDRLTAMKIYLSECKKRGLYEKYKNEIQWHFLEIFYINTLTMFSIRFDKAPATVLSGLKEYILSEMPDYKQNTYVLNAEGISRSLLDMLDKNIKSQKDWDNILSILRDLFV